MTSEPEGPMDKAASRGRPWRASVKVSSFISVIALFGCTAPLFTAGAFTFLGNTPHVWPGDSVPMVLKLGEAGRTLRDGNTSWDAVAGQALAEWNSDVGTIQFSATIQSPGKGSERDYVNQVFFNSNSYGLYLGKLVLAMTTSWYVENTMVEADVTFNTAIAWDSYDGPLQYENGRLVCD